MSVFRRLTRERTRISISAMTKPILSFVAMASLAALSVLASTSSFEQEVQSEANKQPVELYLTLNLPEPRPMPETSDKGIVWKHGYPTGLVKKKAPSDEDGEVVEKVAMIEVEPSED